MKLCVKTGAVIRWAWQEELLALGWYLVGAAGHCLGIQSHLGNLLWQRWLLRGASPLAPAAPWRRLAQLAGFGRSRGGHSGLLSCPTQGEQPWQQWHSPGWSLTAAAQTESGRRKCPCSVPLSCGRHCFVCPWSRVWTQLQHWIGLGFSLSPVCKLWYCLFKIPYKLHVIC